MSFVSQKYRSRAFTRHRSVGGELLLDIIILLVCTVAGMLFHTLGLSDANIIVIFILGMLVTATLTHRRWCLILILLADILIYDLLFAQPRFTFNFVDPQYLVTAGLMLVVGLMTAALADDMRRSLEAEARLKEEKLRVDLLRSISHDLRTPLTGISGNASLLLSDGDNMSRQQREQLYQSLCYNSEWMVSMVENILYVTRLENHSLAPEKSPELLTEIAEEAMLHLCTGSVQHHIELELTDELLFVDADAIMLAQVALNLINNAIQHTPEGSEIMVQVFRDGEQAVFQVADNGPGVAEEDRERIFQMFVSAAANNGETRRGMGIGLAVSQAIIQAHNGELFFRDNKPSGAIFGFSLPLESIPDLNNESEEVL